MYDTVSYRSQLAQIGRLVLRPTIGGRRPYHMVTARALVERDPTTMHMITFRRDEHPRSMQLYGVDPTTVSEAIKIIVGESLADHTDMNFGCPKSTH